MKKYVASYVTLGCALLFQFLLCASSIEEADNQPKTLRIVELLPSFPYSLAIEPALPNDFVAMNESASGDPYKTIYWGPRATLEKLKKDRGFINRDTLDHAIIAVQLSPYVTQNEIEKLKTSKTAFKEKFESLMKTFGKQLPNIRLKNEPTQASWNWGPYPVHSCEWQADCLTLCMVWVGLNTPEGMTLCCALISPSLHPNKKDLAMWHTFLQNTTAFPESHLIQALGYDLQPGYTVASFHGMSAKITAEKRRSDGMLQIAVLSLDADLQFHSFRTVRGYTTTMAGFQEDIAKIVCLFRRKSDVHHVQENKCVPLRVQTVDEFLVDVSEMKSNNQLFVYQEEPLPVRKECKETTGL